MRRGSDIIGSIVSWLMLAALIAGGWHYRHDINRAFRSLAGEYLPCAVPIRYTVDGFDSRFGISRQEFEAVIQESADAWSSVSGKPLFKEVEGGELEINLVYDYRQQATDQLKGMGISIETDKSHYEQLKSEYDRRKKAVDDDSVRLEMAISQFEARRDAYESQAKEWMEKGGAPPAEYQRLSQEKRELERMQAEIRQDTDALNRQIDDLNAVVTVLNGVAGRLNLEVQSYNQTAGARGEKFQEGEYIFDAEGSRINIYEFSDKTMLRRVMMHELGHALGLEHIDDSEAIMYELNLAPEAELTSSDSQAIQDHCRLQLPW